MKKIINKLGIQNFILIMFIVLIIVVSGLYQTFSIYTSSDGVSIIDSIKTFKFILNNSTTLNSVTIAGNSSKNIAITISNDEDIKLKYGIYYSSSNNLDNVEIGYKHDSDYLPTGLIDKNSDYIVTIKIENNTSSNVTIDFGIVYGLENGGDLELDSNKYFIENMASYPLSEAGVGEYIAYTGNNGCTGNSCLGYNANYVSDDDMGYCANSKFIVNGWRVMSKDINGVYIVSAGATDCMCTDENGVASNTSCDTYLSGDNLYKHVDNMNNIALKYCNSSYAKGGVCNSSTAWSMKNNDFQKITGSSLLSCSYTSSEACGLNNTLIDNGSWYWFDNKEHLYYWNVEEKLVGGNYSSRIYGIRPVIYLSSDIKITGGSGTYEDAYTLKEPEVLSEVGVGSYIAYTGNNGCTGNSCLGYNANYVSDDDMGYCVNSNYKFNVNGWRVMAKDSNGVYIVSAGATDCMCTDEEGITSSTSCDTYLSGDNLYKHVDNMNNIALKYCNSSYAKGGVCNSSTAWSMKNNDFQKITGSSLLSCSYTSSEACGLNNTLIDNGSWYWFDNKEHLYYWNMQEKLVGGNYSSRIYGIRPVIYLSSDIKITGGSGTYTEPYQLS